MEYGDLISYREQEISSSTIDNEGKFSFRFSRFEAGYFFFRIDHARMGFFAEPGKNYQFTFNEVNFDRLNDRINPWLNPWFFEFTIAGHSLNNNIEMLEDKLYQELAERYSAIYTNRNTEVFRSIVEKVDKQFLAEQNRYFSEYKRYKIGYYRHAANLVRFNELVRDYFIGQPVLYNNTQYMNLFNTVFETFIFAGSRNITIRDLQHTVNNLGSYHALMDSLGKDTILRNEVLRELVMIKGLQSMHGNPDFNIANIESMLRFTFENSKFPQHRIISKNVLHQLTYLRAGEPAPSFQFANRQGIEINFPGNYSGKPTLLVFWTSWCETCQVDFSAITELLKRYNNGFNVIGVSADRHNRDFNSMLNNANLPWENLYFNRDFRLLDAFQVRTFPTYMLIGQDGKIISYPAPKPSDELVQVLDRLMVQPLPQPQRPGRRR